MSDSTAKREVGASAGQAWHGPDAQGRRRLDVVTPTAKIAEDMSAAWPSWPASAFTDIRAQGGINMSDRT